MNLPCSYFSDKLFQILKDVVYRYGCSCIALSGGIDTSVIALTARAAGLKLNGFLAIYRGGLAKDIPYAIYIAKSLGIELNYVFIDVEKAYEVAEKVVECIGRDKLNSHGDGGCIEIRNDIAFYSIMLEARDFGCNCIYTGSGGDELFSGYGFMVMQSSEDIRRMIESFVSRGRYPELEIARCVGVKAVSPYLDREVLAIALEVPIECLRTVSMMGKDILRIILTEHGLQWIALRGKTPTESGSGTKAFCKSIYD